MSELGKREYDKTMSRFNSILIRLFQTTGRFLPGGGGGGQFDPPKYLDHHENLHACQVKCIKYYGNFNSVKKILICIFMVIYANKVIKSTFLPINHILFMLHC